MMKNKMTIKCWFLKEFPTCKCKRNKPDLCKLGKLDSPVLFCVDAISIQIARQLERNEKEHCDEFVFCNVKDATGIYCIENKGGRHIDLSKIRDQLQGGAKIIEARLDPSEAFGFMPVLVTSDTSGIPPSFSKELIRHKIKFKNRAGNYHIKHIMINDLLSSLSFDSIIIPATNQRGCPTL